MLKGQKYTLERFRKDKSLIDEIKPLVRDIGRHKLSLSTMWDILERHGHSRVPLRGGGFLHVKDLVTTTHRKQQLYAKFWGTYDDARRRVAEYEEQHPEPKGPPVQQMLFDNPSKESGMF
tara:strand:+ start:3622 stop:3981 length:360 start_codon:yes stop_codon:yes gene_type:complete